MEENVIAMHHIGSTAIPGIYAKPENVHTYEAGSPEIIRHLAFRDYMIAHPDIAQH